MPRSATRKRRGKPKRRQPKEQSKLAVLQRLTDQRFHVDVPSMERYVPGGRATVAAFGRWGKLATLLTALPFLLVQAIYSAPLNITGPDGIALDFSWLLALPYQLQHGQVSGRDFSFTYGVLAQIISMIGWLPVRSNSIIDAAGMIFLMNMVATVIILVITLALAKLVNAWQVLLITIVFMILNIAPGVVTIRELTTVACAVFLGCALAERRAQRRLLFAGLMGLLCFGSQLFSVELAPFTVGGTIIVLSLYAVLAATRSLIYRPDLMHKNDYLAMLGVVLTTFLLSNFAADTVFKLTGSSYNGFFNYQLDSFAIVRGYNQTLGVMWSLPTNLTVCLTIMALFTGFSVIMLTRRVHLRDQYTLICLLVFSTLQLKGAIVRSDNGHILANTIPLVFLFLILSKYCIPTNWFSASLTLPWLTLFIALFQIWQISDYSLITHPTAWIDKFSTTPDKLASLVAVRSTPSTYLPSGFGALPNAGMPMMDFPYDNYIAMALHRPLVAPVLQTYAAETTSLQRQYTARLASVHDLTVVYGIDGISAAEVDGVQNITRVPVIFEYLYRHFELQSRRQYGKGNYILRRSSYARTLPVQMLHFTVTNSSSHSLFLRVSPHTACSLVQIGLRVWYPLTALLGRPDSLNVRFMLRDRLFLLSNLVPVEIGKGFTTYVSLMNASRFSSLFGGGATQSVRWDAMQISTNDTGLFGVPPNGLSVTRLGCVRASG